MPASGRVGITDWAGGERTAADDWAVELLARQVVVLDDLGHRARAAHDEAAALMAWLALARQAERFLRGHDAAGWKLRRSPEAAAAHRVELLRRADEARSHLADAGREAQMQARRSLGLRVAIVGKGGAGKSFISGVLARHLARKGRMVLAADFDTNPGLAINLGLPPTHPGMAEGFAIEQRDGPTYGWDLAGGLSPAAVVERFTAPAADGVRFLGMGKIGEDDLDAARRTDAAMHQVVVGFADPAWDVVGDLEAGTTTPFQRFHLFADIAVVVVNPSKRTALTARRLFPMIDLPKVIVANKFADEADHPGLEPRLRIPFDPQVAEAERLGVAALDHCPDAPAVLAVAELAELLLSEEVRV